MSPISKFLVIIIFISGLILSCGDATTSYPLDESNKYDWKIKSLYEFGFPSNFSTLSALNSTKIWNCNLYGCSVYDGNKWEELSIGYPHNIAIINSSKAFTVSLRDPIKDRVHDFYKYNGDTWDLLKLQIKDELIYNCDYINFLPVSENEIYFVGVKVRNTNQYNSAPLFIQYKDNQIKELSEIEEPLIFSNIVYDDKTKMIYIEADEIVISNESYYYYRLYQYDGNKLSEIYNSKDQEMNIIKLDGNVYFHNNSKIFLYDGHNFIVKKDLSQLNKKVNIIEGFNLDDFYFSSVNYPNTYLYHYSKAGISLLYTTNWIFDLLLVDNKIVFSGLNGNSEGYVAIGSKKK